VGLKILCSGHLVRHPVGGHTWHHLQYLVGLQRLGHEVYFFEHFGWPNSCYDPKRGAMTSEPTYGISYVEEILKCHGLQGRWCYLSEDGKAYGMSREQLSRICEECDFYFNLSNINWIPELEHCRRRVLVDTDPVFSQIGSFGMGGPFSRYHRLFTYGENVHHPSCDMPTGGASWLPTRQPIVLDLWEPRPASEHAPVTTVMNWSAYGDAEFQGRVYGQKDRQFEPFFSFPRLMEWPMVLAVNAPRDVADRLRAGGWGLVDPTEVSRSPWTYQQFITGSIGEFSVAKHAYVVTRSGWFSDRSASYLASGRPVVVEDTGFSRNIPCGKGLMAFKTPAEAKRAVEEILTDSTAQGVAARALAEEYFDATKVLTELLERSA